MEETPKSGERGLRKRINTVGREAIPCRQRGRVPEAVMDHIEQPTGCSASATRFDHRNWRVIHVDLVTFQHYLANAADDGASSAAVWPTEPASIERSMSRPWTAIISDCLKRQTMFELGEDVIRSRCKRRPSARDRLHWRSRLGNLLRSPAAVFWSDAPYRSPVYRQGIE